MPWPYGSSLLAPAATRAASYRRILVSNEFMDLTRRTARACARRPRRRARTAGEEPPFGRSREFSERSDWMLRARLLHISPSSSAVPGIRQHAGSAGPPGNAIRGQAVAGTFGVALRGPFWAGLAATLSGTESP